MLDEEQKKRPETAGPVKPPEVDTTPDPAGKAPAGPVFEELLRSITKIEKPEDRRVVDVFE